MKKINLAETAAKMPRMYKNFGQRAEQVARKHATGEIVKADHIKATESGDLNGIQIKTRKATICNGISIKEYIATNAATEYAFITEDYQMYIMTAAEFEKFAKEFSYIDYDSKTKEKKIRFYGETVYMRIYLENAVK